MYYSKIGLKHGLDRPVYYTIYKLSLGFYHFTMLGLLDNVLEIIGNTSLRHAWCWSRGLGAQSPRLSQSSGLEVHGTRAAMVGRWIKVMIKNDRWAVTPVWVMEQKAEPVTTGSPSGWITECINYEYPQSICKNKYFITCAKVVYISTGVFVKMYWFWILSSPPPCLQLLGGV